MPHLPNKDRSIDWLEATNRSLQSKFSGHAGVQKSAPRLTERLSILLLERLPEPLAHQMIELLPRNRGDRFKKPASSESDPSIGLTSFIEAASQILGMEEDLAQMNDELPRETAESFLWAITQELPMELKTRMREILPLELCSRMNLNHSTAEDSRVA
jgi:hypothetical protein